LNYIDVNHFTNVYIKNSNIKYSKQMYISDVHLHQVHSFKLGYVIFYLQKFV